MMDRSRQGMTLLLSLCLLLCMPPSLFGALSGIQCTSCGAFIGLADQRGTFLCGCGQKTDGAKYRGGRRVLGLQRKVLWAEGPMVKIRSGDAQRTVSVAVGRDLLQSKCARCHSLKPVYLYRKSEQEWRLTVNRMVAKDTGSATECQADSIVGYLASALGSVN